MKFVLDASVTLTWLLKDSKPAEQRYAQTILESLGNSSCSAVVPAIWPFELTNVLAKAESKNLLTEAHSHAFLALLDDLDIEVNLDSTARLNLSGLQLARRYKLSTYDASYLELAMQLQLPLATLDHDLHKAAQKAGVAKFTAAP